MKIFKKTSEEYKIFLELEHWKSEKVLFQPKYFLSDKNKFYPLFLYLYQITERLYGKLPLRKNGENPLIHPLNVMINLKKAEINDEITLCAGLIHDYIEESVDVYRDANKIKEDAKGIKILDAYEEKVFVDLEEELRLFSKEKKINFWVIKDILSVTKLLTRHKRDFYCRSIIELFICDDEKIREKAIQVKLADRIHNILCIESFNEQQRMFQCFKNLFILNNTKKYFKERAGKQSPATEKLFKKCGKATYDAFLKVCLLCEDKGIKNVTSMIQLAFKKFALENNGLWEVTEFNEKEKHPVRLFQGIIRKYDYRLHHEWKFFDGIKDNEFRYCKRFFADFKFNDEQIRAIIDYKDAYSSKELVAYLMYLPNYTLGNFDYDKLFRRD